MSPLFAAAVAGIANQKLYGDRQIILFATSAVSQPRISLHLAGVSRKQNLRSSTMTPFSGGRPGVLDQRGSTTTRAKAAASQSWLVNHCTWCSQSPHG
jgi:hypothetical protein